MAVNPRTSAESEVKFVVLPNGFTNLLGLKTIQEFGFITINEEYFISQIKTLNSVIWEKPLSGPMKMPNQKCFRVGKFRLRSKNL